MKARRIAFMLIGSVILIGCAQTPEPVAQVTATSSSIASTTTLPPATTTTSATPSTTTTISDQLMSLLDQVDAVVGSNDLAAIDDLLAQLWNVSVRDSESELQYEAIGRIERARPEAIFLATDPALLGPELTDAIIAELPIEFFVVNVGSGAAIITTEGTPIGHLAATSFMDFGLAGRLDARRVDRHYFQNAESVGAVSLSLDRSAITLTNGDVIDVSGRDVATSQFGQFLTVYDWSESPRTSLAIDTTTGEVTEVDAGCRVSLALDQAWYLICGSDADTENFEPFSVIIRRAADGTTERLAGPPAVFDTGDDLAVVGHWSYVEPGPDGSILGQWSGECEVPSAHILIGGEWMHPWFNGSEVVLAADMDWELWSWGQSSALGWLEIGKAAIAVAGGACSSDEDALITVAPDGTYDIIYPHGEASLWRRNE